MSKTELVLASHKIRSALAGLRPHTQGLSGGISGADRARDAVITAIADAVLEIIDELPENFNRQS